MKVKEAELARALDAPPSDIRLFLIHGPDSSGAQMLAKRLERAMGPTAERIDIEQGQLKSDPARLADEAASFSLFGDRRYIRLSLSNDDAFAAIEALLEAAEAGNPVLALATDLKASSRILKLAQASPRAMAAPCYVPTTRDIERTSIGMAREKGLRLSQDLAERLVAATGGDRTQLGAEIEKLALYLDAAPDQQVEVTPDAVQALAAADGEEDAGALVDAVMGGDPHRFAIEFDRIVRAGEDPASFFYIFHRRVALLAELAVEVARGKRPDAVVKASRAVFWKDEATITRQLALWPPERLRRLADRLVAAENASRSSGAIGAPAFGQDLLAISREAARHR